MSLRRILSSSVIALLIMAPTAANAKGGEDSRTSDPKSYDSRDDAHDDSSDDSHDDSSDDSHDDSSDGSHDDSNDDSNDGSNDDSNDDSNEDSSDDSHDGSRGGSKEGARNESGSSKSGTSSGSLAAAQREWRSERSDIDKDYQASLRRAEAILRKELKSADTENERKEAREDYRSSLSLAKKSRTAAIQELGPLPKGGVETDIAQWRNAKESIDKTYSASIKKAENALKASLKTATTQPSRREVRDVYNAAIASAKKTRAESLRELGPAPKK